MAKSKTSKTGLAKKKGFQFKWWMGLIIVGIVAVVGLVVLNFSNASSVTKVYAAKSGPRNDPGGCPSYNNQAGSTVLEGAGRWCLRGTFTSGLTRFKRLDDGQCAFMKIGTGSKGGDYLKGGAMPINSWVTVYETTSCDL